MKLPDKPSGHHAAIDERENRRCPFPTGPNDKLLPRRYRRELMRTPARLDLLGLTATAPTP